MKNSTRWWSLLENGKILCELCPRNCQLNDGQRAFCFSRKNENNEMILTTYAKSTGFCIDPIEKKPLNHFYPGTSVLSFGTAGCNLGCKFCQNWDISKSKEIEILSESAMPEQIAQCAFNFSCKSVAFTYNDPVLWAEYAIDTAKACHDYHIKTVAVTAGYISEKARKEFFQHFDAVNVDLKAFTEEFYHSICYGHLQPVLDTLKFLKNETNVWLEITTLLIPEKNDSDDEVKRECEWILENLGVDTPLHFTAFHPDYKMNDIQQTPLSKVQNARKIAQSMGLHHVYTGNVHDVLGQSTYCNKCGQMIIKRDWYEIDDYHIADGKCSFCKQTISGCFENIKGTWGSKRMPVKIIS